MADMVPDGYYTANYGKWHLGDEVIKRKGFDRWVPTEDVYRAYYSDPKHLSIFSDYHHFLVDNGFVPDQVYDRLGLYSDEEFIIRPAEGKGMDTFSLRFVSKLPEEFTKASFLGKRTAEFIHENSARPFFLMVSLFEPHPPFAGPFYDLYGPHSVPVGPAFLKHPPANASRLAPYTRQVLGACPLFPGSWTNVTSPAQAMSCDGGRTSPSTGTTSLTWTRP